MKTPLLLFILSITFLSFHAQNCKKFEHLLNSVVEKNNDFLNRYDKPSIQDFNVNIDYMPDYYELDKVGTSILDSLNLNIMHTTIKGSIDFSNCIKEYTYDPQKSDINILISKTGCIKGYGNIVDLYIFDRRYITPQNAFLKYSILFRNNKVIKIHSTIKHSQTIVGFNEFDKISHQEVNYLFGQTDSIELKFESIFNISPKEILYKCNYSEYHYNQQFCEYDVNRYNNLFFESTGIDITFLYDYKVKLNFNENIDINELKNIDQIKEFGNSSYYHLMLVYLTFKKSLEEDLKLTNSLLQNFNSKKYYLLIERFSDIDIIKYPNRNVSIHSVSLLKKKEFRNIKCREKILQNANQEMIYQIIDFQKDKIINTFFVYVDGNWESSLD